MLVDEVDDCNWLGFYVNSVLSHLGECPPCAPNCQKSCIACASDRVRMFGEVCSMKNDSRFYAGRDSRCTIDSRRHYDYSLTLITHNYFTTYLSQ
jgi:hypothetical protein